MLYDTYNNYTAAFLLAGVPPIVGAGFMCLIHRVGGPKSDLVHQVEAEEILPLNEGHETIQSSNTLTTLLSESDEVVSSEKLPEISKEGEEARKEE